MFPRIIKAQYLQGFQLELSFADGKKGVVDFHDRVVGRGGVFQALEEVSFFQQVKVDSEAGTIIWPNDVDFDPDVLYSEAVGVPLSVPEI